MASNYRLKPRVAGRVVDVDWLPRVPTYNKNWIYVKTTYYSRIKSHDDVIKWKQFPRYWPVVRGIHRSPVNSPHKGQWRGALMFSLICAWINGWANNRENGDLRRRRAYYDVIVMCVSDPNLDPYDNVNLRPRECVDEPRSSLHRVMDCRQNDFSHYLNQRAVIVNWTLGNEFQWSLNQNAMTFIKKMHIECGQNCRIVNVLTAFVSPLLTHFWMKMVPAL